MNWANSKRKNLGWITTFGAFLFGVTVPMLFVMKLRKARIAAVEANKITELKRLESQQQAEVLQVNLAKSHFRSGLFLFKNGFAEEGIRELVAARQHCQEIINCTILMNGRYLIAFCEAAVLCQRCLEQQVPMGR